MSIAQISCHFYMILSRNSRWEQKTEPSYMGIHRDTKISNIHWLPQWTTLWEPHLPTAVNKTWPSDFRLPPPTINSQAAILLRHTSISKPQAFFKVKGHRYWNVYILSNLACLKLCYIFRSIPSLFFIYHGLRCVCTCLT